MNLLDVGDRFAGSNCDGLIAYVGLVSIRRQVRPAWHHLNEMRARLMPPTRLVRIFFWPTSASLYTAARLDALC